MKKYRIHLRHTGIEPFTKPGLTKGIHEDDPYFLNIYLGGRYFLAIREADPKMKQEFFDTAFGRAQLRYRREEKACPWPGTDHYYGICNCPNKQPTHPRYL